MYQNPHQPAQTGPDPESWLRNYAQTHGGVLQRYLSNMCFLNDGPPVGFPQEISFVHQIYRQYPFLIPAEILQSEQCMNWAKMIVSNLRSNNMAQLSSYVATGGIHTPGPIQSGNPHLDLLHAILYHSPHAKNDLQTFVSQQSSSFGRGPSHHSPSSVQSGWGNQPMMPNQGNHGGGMVSAPTFPPLGQSPYANQFNGPSDVSVSKRNRYAMPDTPMEPSGPSSLPEPIVPVVSENTEVPSQSTSILPPEPLQGAVVTAKEISDQVGPNVSKTVTDQDVEPSDYQLIDEVYFHESLTSAVINASFTRIAEGDSLMAAQICQIENPYYGIDVSSRLEQVSSDGVAKFCQQMNQTLRMVKKPLVMAFYRQIEEMLNGLVNDRLSANHSTWKMTDGFFDDYVELIDCMRAEDEPAQEHEIADDIANHLRRTLQCFSAWDDPSQKEMDDDVKVTRSCIPEIVIMTAINKTKAEIAYEHIPHDALMLLESAPLFKFLYDICLLLKDNLPSPETEELESGIYWNLATRYYIATSDYGCIEVVFDRNHDNMYLRRAV